MRGKTIVEQVDHDGNTYMDSDISLSPKGLLEVLKTHFPNIREDNGMIIGDFKGHPYSIRVKNITYLGIPHPVFKKRIQISGDLQSFYSDSQARGMTPILLGVYTRDDLTLFCDFDIEDFVAKKSNNSSAHVYTEDLSFAAEDGIFQKTDYRGNHITVFRKDYVAAYLTEKFNLWAESSEASSDVDSKTDILDLLNFFTPPSVSASGAAPVLPGPMPEEIVDIFRSFFQGLPSRWDGIDCYREMIADNYRNKFQPEWAGFYLEYLFEKYLKENSLEHLIRYEQNKKKNGIDLDLFFPTLMAYGDLKAHSDHSKGIQGNDWDTIFGILGQTDYERHIYYIICEHATYKDSEYGYETTQFWNRAQGKPNLMSYQKRMKHHVVITRMHILDINNSNKQFLGKFRQGINSNGKLREPKIMIDHDMISKFSICDIQLSQPGLK